MEKEEEQDNDASHSHVDSDFEVGDQAKARASVAIAMRETGFVRKMRLLVIAVLAAATSLAGLGVFYLTYTTEKTKFEDDFQANADKVMSALSESVDTTFTAMDSLAVTIVSYATLTNSTWPYVTLPDFEVRSAKIRALSKVVVLNLYMRVPGEQRTSWEAYAMENNFWVNESMAVQERSDRYYGPIIYDWYAVDEIHDYYEEPQPPGHEEYWPWWQASPAIPVWAAYNWDLLSYSNDIAINSIRKKHRPMFTETYNIPNPDSQEEMDEYEVDTTWFKDYVSPEQKEKTGEPAIDIYYPLLDTLRDVTIKDPENHPLVGMLSASSFWRNFLEGILPEGSDGIVMVFENECNPTFTYQIDGPKVSYLGRGDLHDTGFDEYEVSGFLLEQPIFQENTTSGYAGIPHDKEFCPSFIRIFPSQTMKNDYYSRQPYILTAVAVVIFVFTSLIFVGYDRVVEYRQRLVLKTATTTSAIVDSLFPSNVRDRLMNEAAETEKNNTAQKTSKPSEVDLATAFFPHDVQEDIAKPATRPIADLFDETTVFFADLAGFTAWSSVRTPIEVFEMLEILFGAFDKIARKRKVFKVETIGDCYVAVAGIPNPQEQHAIIMVKFARDCMMRLSLLVNELSHKFGEDTRKLQMRVGLHSGPTTAGVLRGEKSRFQLFGDTVNTASRMESNGVPGRIHVSQATANQLIAKGKGSWLTPREDR
eukprot:scaffold4042_cov165-Amphora_coffeaeformis.AAC.9